MRGEKSPLKGLFGHWTSILVKYGSVHGLNWFRFFQNALAQQLVFLFALTIIITVPLFIFFQARDFYNDRTIRSTIQWHTTDSILFPNITLCHPLYFSTERMKEWNVSELVGNYMIYGMNPDVVPYLQFRILASNATHPSTNFVGLLKEAEVALELILTQYGLTYEELANKIAIRCEDFVPFAELGSTVYLFGKSCGQIIDPTPIFTPNAGVCFATQINQGPSVPLQGDNMRIWLNVNEEKSLKLSFIMHGTSAVDRYSPIFIIQGKDNPASFIYHNPWKIPLGEVTSVSLSKTVVDRSLLNGNILTPEEDKCVSQDEEFGEKFKMRYSEYNCGLGYMHFVYKNCTFAQLGGYHNAYGKPACLPSDTVARANEAASVNYTQILKQNKMFNTRSTFNCPKECVREDFQFRLTGGVANFKPLDQYIENAIGPGNHGKFAGLQLFMYSFDYERTILYREGLSVFLSRVGGWLGLAMGASILSVVEIIVFFGYLVRLIFSYWAGRDFRLSSQDLKFTPQGMKESKSEMPEVPPGGRLRGQALNAPKIKPYYTWATKD